MAFNRIFREFRTCKKYRGGLADDIWIFDFKTGKVENITKTRLPTSSPCGRRTGASISSRIG